MILILSNEYDYSTIDVTHWLKHYNIPFVRLNGEEVYSLEKVTLENNEVDFVIYNDEKIIKLSEIKSVWYRRGQLNFTYNLRPQEFGDFGRVIEMHLKAELEITTDLFYFLLKEKPHIGTFERRGMNKLIVLYEAQKVGLKIPETQITATEKYTDFENLKPYITKSISETFRPRFDFGNYIIYTENIDNTQLQKNFFPTLFQEKYEKEADLRIFYLDGKFHRMAIISQSHQQTATDFRKYLTEKPNRSLPFQLPKHIEEKLKLLMDKVELETGSIDMILTRNSEYVFLEVNPIGQFGMTSYPCNYFLERQIAKTLIEKSYENTR
ncbi:MAG: grasp-with-spasm system ATP-grasp peptide maturase [Saprospiraceae bacterium]